MKCIHCNEPGAHPGTRKCTDLEACHGRQEYARGVADERARHMGGTPFVSREEDFRLGVRTERARVVADLRAEANLLRTLTTNWVSHEESARKLDYAADRYERGEHKEGK